MSVICIMMLFCFYFSKLQCIIASSNIPCVFILGDFNANIQSTSIFGAELIDFCDNNELCFVDREKLLPDTFTYNISQSHGTTSWLDHCITSHWKQHLDKLLKMKGCMLIVITL